MKSLYARVTVGALMLQAGMTSFKPSLHFTVPVGVMLGTLVHDYSPLGTEDVFSFRSGLSSNQQC